MVTQGAVIRSEWIKLRSVRSSWLMLGATVLGIAGVGLLVAYVKLGLRNRVQAVIFTYDAGLIR
jgi:hypothetical protein